MPVKVTLDKNAVIARIQAANEKALKEIKGQVLSDCNEFVPNDHGVLKDSSESHSYVMSFFGESELRLIWSAPYARYLYYGLLMVDSVTGSSWARKGSTKSLTDKPLTYAKGCKLWCEKARELYNEDWRLMYQNALRKHMK
ncbi:MAG: minor capsid protein [Bacteroides sp.]|nr:minor capsid protein [Bacteroides sp.]